jgi:PAS domain S-box-containing protein
MKSLSTKTKIYISLVSTLGWGIFILGILNWRSEGLYPFLGFLLISSVASTFKVVLPGIMGSISVSFLFILMGVLDLSFSETLVMGLVAGFIQSYWKAINRPQPVQVIFSVSTILLAISASYSVYHYLCPSFLKVVPGLMLGLASCAYFVTNTFLVAGVISLVEKKQTWRLWQDCYFWSFPYYLIGAAIAMLLNLSKNSIGWKNSLLVLPIIYFIYRSYRLYIGRLEAEKSHAEAMDQRSRELQQEINERMRAEQILRESEERYRNLFESNPHPMWVYDCETHAFLAINDAAVVHYGYSREEFLQMTTDDLIEVEHSLSAPNQDPENIMLNRENGVGVHRKKNGTLIDVEIRSHEFQFGGRASRLVLADDVTERRHAEELRIAKETAEAASQAKSEFLANMSHELRTPLNAVIGYSEMLQEVALEEDQRMYLVDLKKIHAAGKHLLGLINDILDLSKIEAGKMELCLETFDLHELVEEVENTIQPLAAKNANTTKVSLPPDLGTMRSDKTKIRQVLFNLLSNAAKFTQGGVIRLEVERQMRKENEWILFRVEDTGIGMNQDETEKIFKPFTQADSSTTRKFGGTGLGLSISRSFCHLMGGTIRVKSVPGQGSIFTVHLPNLKAQPRLSEGDQDDHEYSTTSALELSSGG